MKKLIIAEKIEVARAIAESILKNPDNDENSFYDEKYIITWCKGHLIELSDPEDYDLKYTDRKNINNLPIYFHNWNKKPLLNKAQLNQLNFIKKQLLVVDELIHAGDPDDEGQLIIDELIEFFNYKGKVKRVLINDNTKEKILKSFEKMEDNHKFINIGKSALARQLADKTFGINESRLATIKLNSLQSIGRVQTPTLALVVKRDNSIKNHRKEEYLDFYVNMEYQNHVLKFKFIPNENFIHELEILDNSKISIRSSSKINSLLKELENNIFECEIKRKNAKENPPLPYNLTTLQADMNKRYNYSLSETLKISQNLRDKYKAITYNRTDCEYLDPIHFDEGIDVLNTAMKNINRQYKISKENVSRCFDARKVTSHHAIIPQNVHLNMEKLSSKEKVVYKAIVDRYALQFMPPLEKENIVLIIKHSKGDLVCNLTKIIDGGFKKQFLPSEKLKGDNVSFLENLNRIDVLFKSSYIEIKATKPIPLYTPETLIKDMSSIAKYCSENIKNILLDKDKNKSGEYGGIGTVATRAQIIDILLKRNYLTMSGKYIISTELGKNFISILPDYLKSPDLTAKWWLLQKQVQNGEKDVECIMMDVVNEFNKHKDIAYSDIINYSFLNNNIYGKCPICGGNILKHSKKGYFYCNNRNCDFIVYNELKYFDSKIKITDKRIIKLLNNDFITAKVKSKKGEEYNAKFKLKIVNYENKNYANLERIRGK